MSIYIGSLKLNSQQGSEVQIYSEGERINPEVFPQWVQL